MPSAVELPTRISYAPPAVEPAGCGIPLPTDGDARRESAFRPEEPGGEPGGERCGKPRRERRGDGRAWAGWFVGPMMLLGTACAVLLVIRGADRAFGFALALLVAVSLAWILVSVFWPAAADRTCSECGRSRLERLDPRSTRGVVCAGCGTADPDRSSFLFAEEEDGSLEAAIARDRTAERRAAR